MNEDHVIDQLLDVILVQYQREKKHLSMLFGLKDGTVPLIVPMFMDNDDDRDTAAAACKQLLRDYACTAYLFVTEAWMTILRDRQIARFHAGDYLPPSKDPERIEVLTAHVHYSSGRDRLKAWEVDRGTVIGVISDSDSTGGGALSGRFTGLLSP